MIAQEFKPLIIDFVDEAEKIPDLVAAVLFGSAITGDISKKSDIDILLVFDSAHNPEVGEEVDIVHKIASEIVKKHKSQRSFAFVFSNIRSKEVDADFMWEVARNGIVIWARPSTKIYEPELKPYIIVSYSMKKLKPKNKMAIHRMLYGYKVEKIVGKKKYVNTAKGLVGEFGKKIGDGAFLVPAAKSSEVADLFRKFNVRYEETKVWL
ncbi:MAG: nucleotidyltransferase domain-containing protein [Thermoplasmata archaeon]